MTRAWSPGGGDPLEGGRELGPLAFPEPPLPMGQEPIRQREARCDGIHGDPVESQRFQMEREVLGEHDDAAFDGRRCQRFDSPRS